MDKQLKTETLTFKVDSEQLAMETIEQYKDNQITGGYTLTKYNTTYKKLASLNNIKDPNLIFVGQKLLVKKYLKL